MPEPQWFGNGKVHFTVSDELGERVFVVPDSEPAWSGDPTEIILDIEARTRTRLKNGGNPIKFHRAYTHWRDSRDPNNTVSFAEFCLRRHGEAVDVLDNQVLARVVGMLRGTRAETSGDGQGGGTTPDRSKVRAAMVWLREHVIGEVIAGLLIILIVAVAIWKWPWIKELLG